MADQSRGFSLRAGIFLICVGQIILCFCIPHKIFGDGTPRYEAIELLFSKGQISDTKFSMVGPLFSVPLWFLDKHSGIGDIWWCTRYNFFLFVAFLFAAYQTLKNKVDRSLLLRFILILTAGSMFPNHIMGYLGEPFTAVCVTIGILWIYTGRPILGWLLVVLGVINTPASLVGLAAVVLKYMLDKKQWRYGLPLLIAVLGILAESWLRRGHPLATGYGNDFGIKTLMPYSGLPGFSYPMFFGLLAILFSFGKGLMYFAPGLILTLHEPPEKADLLQKQIMTSWVIFLAGLILVYSKWWCWYGGISWGPRFFLFASIPAAWALAAHTCSPSQNIWINGLVLGILTLSIWVGINGVSLNLMKLGICAANNYSSEFMCWYVPEFSMLWNVFIVSNPLHWQNTAVVVYGLAVYLYLAADVFGFVRSDVRVLYASFKTTYLRTDAWRF